MKIKRGAIKAFREFLNQVGENTPPHRYNSYRQITREYGDYLYFQDREKFDYEFSMGMQGLSRGFDHTQWQESPERARSS